MKVAGRKSRKRRSGVTLLEILVAMVVLTGGLFMVYNIFPKGFAASYRSRNKTISTQLAQQVLEDVLQTRYEVDCKYPNCLYVPPAVSIDSSCTQWNSNYTHEFSAASFNCGKYYSLPGHYGAPGTVRCGTMGHLDTGDVSDPTTWQSFTDNPMFWYTIKVVPVVDPYSNHAAWAAGDRITLYRDFGSCSRVVVRVRGPIENMSNWSALMAAGGTKLPSEVALTTFVASKVVAHTAVRVNETNVNIANVQNTDNDDYSWNYPEKATHILVDDIRNFTFFNHLTQAERNKSWVYEVDESGTITNNSIQQRPNGANQDTTTAPYYVGNGKGIDNVVIVRQDSVDGSWYNGNDRFLVQTNKVVSLVPDNSASATGATVPGMMVFDQPLYYDALNQYQSMIGTYRPSTDSDGVPVDGTYLDPQHEWTRRFCLYSYMPQKVGEGGEGVGAPPDASDYGWDPPANGSPCRYWIYMNITVPRQNGGAIDVL